MDNTHPSPSSDRCVLQALIVGVMALLTVTTAFVVMAVGSAA